MPTMAGLAIEIIILLCIVAIVYLANLSKKRKQWIKTHWVHHTLALQTDIVTLANEYDVSWKLLAHVNQIKPPYTLKKGDVLKVPPLNTPVPSQPKPAVKAPAKAPQKTKKVKK